jgi:restriction modification system DNA specificity domain protein
MREMKDSGIEWIGDIPKVWKLKRLKALLVERKEKNDPVQTHFILSLGANYGVIPYSQKEGGGNKAKEDVSSYRLAYPGDIVMNSMNIISGSVGLSKYFGCVSPVYYMFYPRNRNSKTKYYHYLFQTKVFQHSLLGLGNGILMKESGNGTFNTVRMRIPVEKLNALMLPVPPLNEQERIVVFLDSECATIDTILEKTRASIDEYKKLKQSVITQAVTKGIRGDRPMKDSGIEWIDKIPKEWKSIRLKNLFEFGKGLSITKDNLIDEGIPVISYGQIHSKQTSGVELQPHLFRYVDKNYLDSNPQSIVHSGDFIFADTSEDLEGCGNAVFVSKEMNLFAGYHTIILVNKKSLSNKYYAYLFRSDLWRSQIRSKVSGVKLFSISKKYLVMQYFLFQQIMR